MPYVEFNENSEAVGYYSHPMAGVAEQWMEPEDALEALKGHYPDLTLKEVAFGDPPHESA